VYSYAVDPRTLVPSRTLCAQEFLNNRRLLRKQRQQDVRRTTPIIVIEEPLINRGPFRYAFYLSYILVVAEIFTAPMILGLPGLVALFTLRTSPDTPMLSWRFSVESRALAPLREGATGSGQ
jgi:hypothetical protein